MKSAIAVPVLLVTLGSCLGAVAEAIRLSQNPLITQESSKSLGDDINGPTAIKVPTWIPHPLGRYYLYFAHHRGDHIRLAYADALGGPWKIYEAGVLNVRDTEFYRPQPDPPLSLYKGLSLYNTLYTHVASPEIYIDDEHRQLVLFVHGTYTAGKKWPADPKQVSAWFRENGFGQFTQTAVSADGIHFEARRGVTSKTPYQRFFRWHGMYYSMGRLGMLGRASDLFAQFEAGPNPFEGGSWAGRVRHVALLLHGDRLYVFFSGIGDAPERILLSTIALSADWSKWRSEPAVEVLRPKASYECTDIPIGPSKAGEAEGPEQALRDPGVIEDNGRVILFYSYCGEQGIAAADVTEFVR